MPLPATTLVLDLSASLFLGVVDRRGRVLAARIRGEARGEAAHGLLDEALAEAGIGPADLEAIAVGAGPGSFTGIRVAVAMAQGLAFARRLPLHPFSSLDALRACAPAAPASAPAAPASAPAAPASAPAAPASAPAGPGRRVAAAIAANAGRYYAALGDPPREALVTLDDLLAHAAADAALIHSGPLPDRERLAAAYSAVISLEDAMDFARVAALALSRDPVRDGVLRPNYLMASAAEEKRRAAEGGDAGGPAPGAAGTHR